jgi:histidinol dehydrogenase
MLTLVDLRGYTGDPLAKLPRATVATTDARETVRAIVDDVRARGDTALIEIEQRYGRKEIGLLRIPRHRVKAAVESLDLALVDAIREAAGRIRAYHERQRAEERAPWWRIGAPGSAEVGEETVPLARVGCYVPGGRAAYPSTVLMTAIPAKLAGVGEVCVSVPPSPEGRVHPATLAACHIAGVEEVYAVGGAQAVAALAYGTETVRRVDKIVGPGSIWVTLAKHEVAMDVGVDSFAGPTEVAIIADDEAPASFIAADLVAQAEHDPLATALLITTSELLVTSVNVEIEKQVAEISRREDVEESLRSWGRAVLVSSVEHAVAVANAFAPEHLELALADAEKWVPRVRNAGAVFVGVWSPVALGDYVAGTNHVLPTGGTARFASPLRISDFIKSTAIVRFDRTGVEAFAPAAIQIAELEGLDAHANALRIRLAAPQSNGGPS